MSDRFYRLPLAVCVAIFGGALLIYSQTLGFAWDEGFHMEAAQLIELGRKPYLDFCLAQTPLNAYWNSFWIRIFHNSWHAIHAVATLMTLSAVLLAADFLRTRFPIRGWKLAAVLTAFFLAAGNQMIVEFGVIGQAYGLALFLIVAAFRSAVLAVERDSMALTAGAGILAATAAGSTLLTAPVALVLLLWILCYSPRVNLGSRLASFAGAAAVPLIPILVLFLKSPAVVLFDIFKYHMFYRRSNWPGSTRHDLEVFTSWIGFPQALILGALAAAGLWFVIKRSGWERQLRGEFYLCGWLALAEALFISTAHPTFQQYYLFTVPFLSILAAVGLYAVASQMGARSAFGPAAAVIALVILGLVRVIYDGRDDTTWGDLQKIATEVDRVTPAGAQIYADEQVYFLTRRIPPSGNEYVSSHNLTLPPALAAAVKIVPQPEMDKLVEAGKFATVETCEDADWIEGRKLDSLYKQKSKVADCAVYWDFGKK